MRLVDSDLFNICERVKEVHPSLSIIELEDQTAHSFAIMESCEDGIERLIFKVAELDGRVIERLQQIMHKPLSERMDELERDEHRLKEEAEEEAFEELYEGLGKQMPLELERSGFIQRNVSFAKKGVTRGKG